jgi:hypothetical protein
MKSERHNFTWLGTWAMALTLLLTTDVLAQTATPRVSVAPAEDMRLWSFGECDRRFPYVNTEEHKECVRVVGSAEARDARALRICEVSHEQNREEVDRCKASYRANKEKAAQDSVVTDAPAAAQAPPSEEVMRRVKVITAAAVEANQSAELAAAPPPTEEKPEPPAGNMEPESSPVKMIGLVLLAVVFLGYMCTVARKKQAQSA